MSAETAKQSLADLLRAAAASQPPPAWKQPLLQRAALVSVVDRPLFDAALSPGLPSKTRVTFQQWSALPEVAPMPGVEGGFYVKDEARSRLLDSWPADGTALRAFSARLLRYYRRAPLLDRVALEIVVNPARGLRLCSAAYAEADAAADLSTCAALLRVLRNRLAVFDTHAPHVFDYLLEKEQYLRSRVQFADDFARSSHYLARPALTRKVEAFLAQRRKWLLQIHAKGGLGKTAFLRWLIATRLVVERRGRRRWPVARIDIDHVNRSTVAAAPSLLLVEAASQLDRQLPQERGTTAFGTFLLTYARLLQALTPPVVRQGETAPAQSVELTDGMVAEVESRFCGTLGTRRALLVLDTVEEVVLHNPDAWLATLRLFERVCQRCPGVKVIVSGRYDFRKRSDFNDWTRSSVARRGMATLTLSPLTAPEAYRYLTRLRQLKPGFAARRSRLLARANPFKLAALADRLGAGGTFTRADLSELRDADVDYLIHRIIDRLTGDCELQWLLRYVVVPNELTRDFMADVLIPHVKREAERLDQDQPHVNLPPGADAVKRSASWQRCTGAFDANRLWDALGKYTATSSWITMAAGRPKPQPELVVPMRYLLRSQAVHRDVHADAARYFERKAQAAQGDEAASYTIEAVYHWFQSKGAAAAADWRRLIAGPQITARFVEQVTSSLLTGNYLDDSDRPLPHIDDRPIMDDQTLAAIHGQLARARALIALPTTNRSALIRRIGGHLRAIAAIERRRGETIVPPHEYAVCQAVALWHAQDSDEALALIQRTLDSAEVGDAERLELLVVQGAILAKRGPDAAQQSYEQAAAIASRAHTLMPYDAIRARQGWLFFTSGQLVESAKMFGEAAAGVVHSQGPTARYLVHAGHVIEVLHQSGRWSEIPRWIDKARTFADATAQKFAADQQRRLDFATFRFREVDTSPPTGAVEAQWRAARMAAMLHDETVDAYRLAISLYQKDGDLVASQSCAIDQLEHVVTALGHLHKAKSFAASLEPAGSNWFRGQLALIEMARQQNSPRARQLWRRTWADANTRTDIVVSVRERAVGLAFALTGELATGAAAGELATMLEQVHPPAARSVLLTPFEFWDPVRNKAVKGLPASFLNALPELADDDPDRLLLALPLADALVFAGDGRRARALLERITAALPANEPLLARRVMGSLRRASATPDPAAVAAYLATVNERCASYPNFVLAAHVEQAEWWLECGFAEHAKTTVAAIALADGDANQYRCRYLALKCRLAESAAEAQTYRLRVRGMLAQLGQRPDFVNLDPVKRLVSTHERVSPGAAPEPPLVDLRAHLITVAQLGIDAIEVTVRPHRGSESRHRMGLPPTIVDILNTYASAESLERAMGDFRSGMALLKNMIRPALASHEISRIGLLLTFDDDLLGALPWQWLSEGSSFAFIGVVAGTEPPIETVRWLQATLSRLEQPLIIDGIAGPKTRRVLESWHRSHNDAPENRAVTLTPAMMKQLRRAAAEPVLIMNGGYELERSVRAGYGAFGIDLEKEWRMAPSGPVTSMYEFSPSLLTSVNPRLIHIAMPVAQTGAEIWLVPTASHKANDAQSALTPATLAKQLRAALGPNACPVVIIDVPHTGSRAETLKTMIVRNQFAAQLAAIGQFAVLATGTAGAQTRPLLQSLINHAVTAQSLAEFAGSAISIVGDTPPAIFSSDPTIPL